MKRKQVLGTPIDESTKTTTTAIPNAQKSIIIFIFLYSAGQSGVSIFFSIRVHRPAQTSLINLGHLGYVQVSVVAHMFHM